MWHRAHEKEMDNLALTPRKALVCAMEPVISKESTPPARPPNSFVARARSGELVSAGYDTFATCRPAQHISCMQGDITAVLVCFLGGRCAKLLAGSARCRGERVPTLLTAV